MNKFLVFAMAVCGTLSAQKKATLPEPFATKWNCEEVVVLRKKMSEKQKGFNEKFIVRLDAH